MPKNLKTAINFLETQWSSINKNKLKGITAELRLEKYLHLPENAKLYNYIIPGGWILTPAKNTKIDPVTKGRIAIIPIPTPFSWSPDLPQSQFAAMVMATSYLSQTGVMTYFVKFETGKSTTIERHFQLPAPRAYQTTYDLKFFKTGASGLIEVDVATVMDKFTPRTGMLGLRSYKTGRIKRKAPEWRDVNIVTNLFWKEYSRYFLARNYLLSAADLDFFIIGKSGKAYPIEFKSKQAAPNNKIGDWFGIDVNPFAKLSFFVSLSNNMEALYFVEEVNAKGYTEEFWAVKFSNLLKYCLWVPQGGGAAMGGGRSTTIIVPKSLFEILTDFLPTL